jgi:hypothetical protein
LPLVVDKVSPGAPKVPVRDRSLMVGAVTSVGAGGNDTTPVGAVVTLMLPSVLVAVMMACKVSPMSALVGL